MRMFDFLTSGAVFAGRRGWGVLAVLGLAFGARVGMVCRADPICQKTGVDIWERNSAFLQSIRCPTDHRIHAERYRPSGPSFGLAEAGA